LEIGSFQMPFSRSFIDTVHTLLFLKDAESPEIALFLSLQENSPIPQNQIARITLCSSYGTDVDDDIMDMILQSVALPKGGITPLTALSLIEDIFYKCRIEQASKLLVTDSEIVWKLYSLAEYAVKIPKTCNKNEEECNIKNEEECNLPKSDDRNYDKSNDQEKQYDVIPKLAYPGIWWKVTSIALIICEKSAQSVWSKMLEEHPTLKSLLKMTTSGRYRFPTVDCDDEEREAIKQDEADMRDQEAVITKQLFLPGSIPNKKMDTAPVKNAFNPIRVSARQREKNERVFMRQQEQQAAIEAAEAQRIKKLLKNAQKSIMMYDPRSPARKPPKDAVNLILSVIEMLGLASSLRNCVAPDFLLDTIGCTSRESIERAYDWLIPIISSYPDIIKRLPSNASSFLLLRAYGSDKDDTNTQLLELAFPLLRHVSLCLQGKLGNDSLHAAHVLFADLSERRACI